MSDRDIWTIRAMEEWGGSFVKCLGALAIHADHYNLEIIKTTWPAYWTQYKNLGKNLEEETD